MSRADQGVLYKDSRFMAAFPSVTKTAEGEILVQFRRAPDPRWLLGSDFSPEALAEHTKAQLDEHLFHWDARSHIVQLRLDHELRPLEEPIALATDGEGADQDPSLLRLSCGRLVQASFSWYAVPPAYAGLVKAWGHRVYGGAGNVGCSFLPWGSYTRLSDDSGRSWSERRFLPAIPGASELVPGLRQSHGGSSRGQAIEVGSDIFLPTYTSVEGRYGAYLLRSRDRGENFSYAGRIAQHDDYDVYEPGLSHSPDGTIVCWMRTTDSRDRMATCRSTDRGETFSAPRLHETVGHPVDVATLSDGRLFVCYGYRHPGFGVRAKVVESEDQLDSAEELVLCDGGQGADLGYPWCIELEAGRVLVVYYMLGADGIRHIAYRLVEV